MRLFAAVRSTLGRFRRAIRSVFDGGARDEIKPLNMSIATDRLDPVTDEVVPVEVTIQGDRSNDGEGWPFDPSQAVLGVADAFESRDGGGPVTIADGYEDGVVGPSEVADFENPHAHGKLMDFRLEEIVIPKESVVDGEVTLGLGVFADGTDSPTPAERWNTDTVRVPDDWTGSP